MLKKGSKCKCENDDIFTKNENGGERSIGSSVNDSDDPDVDVRKRSAQRKAKERPYCGSFCRKIGPKDQRRIILECLRLEMNNL